MTIFHHGGRIGDLVFALWSMKALGGGDLIVTDYHHPHWDLKTAESMRSFLEVQPYIERVFIARYRDIPKVDYDFQKAEEGPNGVTHIAQRYAGHFGLEFDHVPWLTAEKVRPLQSVAVHVPMRRSLRSKKDWQEIVAGVEEPGKVICIVMGYEDWTRYRPSFLAQTAAMINSAELFLGTVSCCNAIAEGLGKIRFVEQAPDCMNVNPTVCINDMSNEEVVKEVLRCLR